jgi:hypothetical protein
VARRSAGRSARQILGHSDPKLTARVYSHLGVEDLRGAVERMEGPSRIAQREVG